MEEKIKDILAELIGGADCKYAELGGIDRAFCQQETKNILTALTQTLQEIRKELEGMKPDVNQMQHDLQGKCDFEKMNTLNRVLQVIDKHFNEGDRPSTPDNSIS